MDKGNKKLAEAKFSDNRKKIIKAEKIISELSGYKFRWNEGQNSYIGTDYGFLGNELKNNEYLKDLVIEKEGIHYIRYESIVTILAESVKILQEKVKILEQNKK
jgi:hypothetical protein